MRTEPSTTLAESKRLLYLRSLDADDSLPRIITDHGWTVDLAMDADEAVHLMGHKQYSVGLVHCDGLNIDLAKMASQSEKFTSANSGANWVALLSNIDRVQDTMAQIITRYFYDYHTAPVDVNRLLATLGHAHGMAEMASSISNHAGSTPSFEGMMGISPPMISLRQQITRVATTDFNVLIRGESGTGKELAAEAIHHLSRRANGPFIPVNCGALPRDLIQNELFGHEKGAFTGADHCHMGRIESAQNGTLFLDEVGDLPLELQINLLRFLQEKSIERVGGTHPIQVDVRVVAATNVNLEEAVKRGTFRQDLYYRLNVLQVDAPPLRDRADDIHILAEAFFEKFSKEVNPSLKGLSKQAVKAIKSHHWPGNVRELVNRMQRAVVMCEGKFITIRDLGLHENVPCNLRNLAEARAGADKAIIEETLLHMHNNVSKAARQLDISRVTLYRLMEQHSIDWQGNGERLN